MIKIGEYRMKWGLLSCPLFVSPTGDDGNMAVTERNGGMTLESESGDIWPTEADIVVKNASSLNTEQKAGLGTAEEEEGVHTAWESLEEAHMDKRLLTKIHNCKGLSPENHLEVAEPDPETDDTIFIAPLDGSQAELRSRVIKEVRKPGRSK